MLTVSNYHYIRENFEAKFPSIFGVTPIFFRQQLLLLKKTGVFIHPNDLINNFNEILKPFDISGEQYNVLRILRGQKGTPANMCVIQERMLARTSNTTRLVDKLLLKKFVTRNVCPENRRKIEVLITQKGLDILKELDPKVIEHEQSFSRNLSSSEVEQLNNLLEKYRNK